ncbi:hypothetical protein B0H13DRAFT_1907422 [Mycena leptocephala]|nr:hypothetical protein B0H13DRAFT_1907422 [Mycena leptocephala]
MTFPAASLLQCAVLRLTIFFLAHHPLGYRLSIVYFASLSSDSLAADPPLIPIPPPVMAAQEHHKHHYMDAHRPRCQFVALGDSHAEHNTINPAVGPAAGAHRPSNSAHAIDPEREWALLNELTSLQVCEMGPGHRQDLLDTPLHCWRSVSHPIS